MSSASTCGRGRGSRVAPKGWIAKAPAMRSRLLDALRSSDLGSFGRSKVRPYGYVSGKMGVHSELPRVPPMRRFPNVDALMCWGVLATMSGVWWWVQADISRSLRSRSWAMPLQDGRSPLLEGQVGRWEPPFVFSVCTVSARVHIAKKPEENPCAVAVSVP